MLNTAAYIKCQLINLDNWRLQTFTEADELLTGAVIPSLTRLASRARLESYVSIEEL